MANLDLEAIAHAAAAAADLARPEILSRFRSVAVETKSDGSPVTEADRAAERAIRASLSAAYPDFSILGEEFGAEGSAERPRWIVDPIDGTIGFSRGIALFTTLIALLDESGEPLVGLIDCPALDERYIGWKGGGCWRNGVRTHVTKEDDLTRAIISHGDPFCFELAGELPAFVRMAREIPLLRGYTDAFGHAQVLGGGVGAMLDLQLNLWDAAATQVLIPEAGGVCLTLSQPNDKIGLLFGNPVLVEKLLGFLEKSTPV